MNVKEVVSEIHQADTSSREEQLMAMLKRAASALDIAAMMFGRNGIAAERESCAVVADDAYRLIAKLNENPR